MSTFTAHLRPPSMRPPRHRLKVPPRARTQAGIALMEALVSILIFSFGVLGLIGLEASAVNYSVDAEDRNRAALFASEVASYMWLQGSVTVLSTSAQMTAWTTAIADPTTPMGLPGGNLVINPTGTGNSADIVISWVPKTDNATYAKTRYLTTRVILP